MKPSCPAVLVPLWRRSLPVFVTLLGSLLFFGVDASAAPRTAFPNSAAHLGGKVAASKRPLSARNLSEPLTFAVVLRLRNADELQARVNRNEVITYEEMARLYLPNAADYEAVTRWLQGEGFTITRHDDSNLGVYARGSVAQVQQSLQVQMTRVTVDGEDYSAADSVPSLPADIATPVLGILGLHPYLKLHPQNQQAPYRSAPTPLPGATIDNSYPSRSFSPAQILTAYNAAGLGLTGTGQRIAIAADNLPNTSDLTAFWSRQGVNRTGAYETSTPNGTNGTTTAGVEVTLDTEWSSSIAPGANVRVYAAGDTYFSSFGVCFQQMINDIRAGTALQQLSISFGANEVDDGGSSSGFAGFDNQYMLVLSGLGVSIFASSGDGGSSPNNTLQVEYYASSPNITSVGGTSLGVNGNGTYLGEAAWAGSGGGASVIFNRPSWQVGNGVPAGSTRLVPDVCLPADPYTGCDLTYNGQIYDSNGNTSGYVEGGTSWSSPTWAGLCSLINQSRAAQNPVRPTLGLVASRVYPLIGTNNFFDVTTGSNGSYSAAVGYDETTGVGSPNMANLVNTLTGPVITSFSPTSGGVGASVVITGKNLNIAGSVTFNGQSAPFTINSPTQITATVPSGATTGKIVVSNAQVTNGVSGDTFTSTGSFTVFTIDLAAALSTHGSFTQGDTNHNYTLSVSNVGTVASTGTVSVAITLPQGLTATALTGTGWTIAANQLSATRTDSLAASGSYPLVLTLSVAINASSPLTIAATVSGGGESNTANDTASSTITVAAATPEQSWRYQYFGTTANTGNAADSANPAGDGISNLLKYALGLNPLLPEVNPEAEDISTGYLRLTLPKNSNATDLTYTVQVTSDLTDPTSWTSTGTTIDQNTTTLLQVQDNTPVSGTAKRFLRLQVTR